MKTLVLGLGNPILSDDSIGIHIIDELRRKTCLPDVTFSDTDLAGFSLLDLLSGYDKAILIDAIQTKEGKPGQVYHFNSTALTGARHFSSLHDVNLTTALELGRQIGMDLPGTISIYGIEVEDVTTFSEECTDNVKKAIPVVQNMVLAELAQG